MMIPRFPKRSEPIPPVSHDKQNGSIFTCLHIMPNQLMEDAREEEIRELRALVQKKLPGLATAVVSWQIVGHDPNEAWKTPKPHNFVSVRATNWKDAFKAADSAGTDEGTHIVTAYPKKSEIEEKLEKPSIVNAIGQLKPKSKSGFIIAHPIGDNAAALNRIAEEIITQMREFYLQSRVS